MTLPMLFKNHFQMGYAVKDVDKAIENLSEKFGLSKWQVVRLPKEAPVNALAWAYVKDMMIELIEVKLGRIPAYDAWVPESESAMKLHHLGYVVETEEEWQLYEETLKKFGMPLVLDDEIPNIMSYRYFDTVAELGHYCEFVLLKPSGKNFWSKVPHN